MFYFITKNVIFCILFVSFINCTSMRQADRDILYQLKECGISDTEQAIKSPGLAGILNILPGAGNFYLAVGSEETSQWALGFLNLLLWPISIIWGVPEAVIDANIINKRETIYYYRFNDNGKAKFKKCKSYKNNVND